MPLVNKSIRQKVTSTRSAVIVFALIFLAALGLIFGISYRNSIRPNGIVIHHSVVVADQRNKQIDATALDEIHQRRGFGIFYWGRVYHIGYHYVILPDGTLQQGRPEGCQGAHTSGYNSYIGICLVGDFSTNDNPNGERRPANPTQAQMQSLINIITRLRERYNIPLERVIQHRDINPNTECPGDRFPFNQLIEKLKSPESIS